MRKTVSVLQEESGKHSSARWLAFMWGIGALLLAAGMLICTGSVDHLVIGAFLGASLSALGLRKKEGKVAS